MAIVSEDGIYENELQATMKALDISPPTTPSEGSTEPAGALKKEEGTQVAQKENASPEAPVARSIIDKLTGATGERYKLWPERMINDYFYTAGKVSRGEVPMWAMDEKGEYHTSVEGLEASHTMLHGGTIFPKIHLRGEGLKVLTEATAAPENTSQVFADFMRTRGRRQQSNIVEGEVLPPEPRQPAPPARRQGEGDTDYALRVIASILDEPEVPYNVAAREARAETPAQARRADELFSQEDRAALEELDQLARETQLDWTYERARPLSELQRMNPDEMSDANFYRWGEHQSENSMTPEQEARWVGLDEDWARRRNEEYHSTSYEQEPFDVGDDIYRPSEYYSDTVQKELQEAAKSDFVKLVAVHLNRGLGNQHKFAFANKDGVGELKITERRGGKELYVDWIGEENHSYRESPGTFGGMRMRDIIKQLKERFPQAEWLAGFRVSGARAHSGRGSADARMRIRKPSETSAEAAE